MRSSLITLPLLTILCASLSACGGGDSATPVSQNGVTLGISATSVGASKNAGAIATASTTESGAATMGSSSAYIPQSRGTAATSALQSTTPITSVILTSTAKMAQSSAAVTFGQAFAEGDIPNGMSVIGKTASGATVPLQVDAKARHADGSLRHAVITVQLPSISQQQAVTVDLYRGVVSAAPAGNPATLLNAGFSAAVKATINGVQYTASADEVLKSGRYATWLSGPLANEWLVAAPLKTASGTAHPHLMARFAIRSYTGSNSARVDVTVENGWAYEAAPQNFTYDAQVLVGDQPGYTHAALTHYHHARWRKVLSWGSVPALDVRHDIKYLIASKAVPNYDQSLTISEKTITSWNTRWTNGKTGPMDAGVGTKSMGTTGARADIGPMPAWNALYLLSMDQRMKNISIGMSELAGSWSAHYRNKNTDRPVTLAEYPYMTAIAKASDTYNKTTKKQEAFPPCPKAMCETPMKADTAHQPALSYLPYLVTGDYYHLEELQFWANFNSFYGSPGYRQNVKGLVKADQVRGQAWSLRTIAEAAYITPDNDPQKTVLNAIVNHNIDWYDSNYTNNPAANKLGVLDHGSMSYAGGNGVAPWQDDFFTNTVGRLVELGYTRAQPFLAWKSKFVVDRMVGDGFCWIQASMYAMKLRDSVTSGIYPTIADVYRANNTAEFLQLDCASQAMADSLGRKLGSMVEYSSVDGGQSIMRPALAYSSATQAKGKQAWLKYQARPIQPDFATSPQYAIVPR